jgi:hypothetical protein
VLDVRCWVRQLPERLLSGLVEWATAKKLPGQRLAQQ